MTDRHDSRSAATSQLQPESTRPVEPGCTRRAFLRGASVAAAGAGLSVAASTLSAASESYSPSSALSMLCAEYHDAHVAARNAELAWRKADNAFRSLVLQQYMWVPIALHGTARVGELAGCVLPHTALNLLKREEAKELGLAADRNARRRVRYHFRRFRSQVGVAEQRVTELRFSSGFEAAINAETDARHRSYAAKDALMAFRPDSLDDVAAITRCLYLTAQATEQFYAFPSRALSIMLNPDLGEGAR